MGQGDMTRDERLAAALRTNLRRRKAQAREREVPRQPDDDGEGSGERG